MREPCALACLPACLQGLCQQPRSVGCCGRRSQGVAWRGQGWDRQGRAPPEPWIRRSNGRRGRGGRGRPLGSAAAAALWCGGRPKRGLARGGRRPGGVAGQGGGGGGRLAGGGVRPHGVRRAWWRCGRRIWAQPGGAPVCLLVTGGQWWCEVFASYGNSTAQGVRTSGRRPWVFKPRWFRTGRPWVQALHDWAQAAVFRCSEVLCRGWGGTGKPYHLQSYSSAPVSQAWAAKLCSGAGKGLRGGCARMSLHMRACECWCVCALLYASLYRSCARIGCCRGAVVRHGRPRCAPMCGSLQARPRSRGCALVGPTPPHTPHPTNPMDLQGAMTERVEEEEEGEEEEEEDGGGITQPYVRSLFQKQQVCVCNVEHCT